MALHWRLSRSLMYWGTQKWTQCSTCSLSTEGKDHFPQPSRNTPPNATRRLLGPSLGSCSTFWCSSILSFARSMWVIEMLNSIILTIHICAYLWWVATLLYGQNPFNPAIMLIFSPGLYLINLTVSKSLLKINIHCFPLIHQTSPFFIGSYRLCQEWFFLPRPVLTTPTLCFSLFLQMIPRIFFSMPSQRLRWGWLAFHLEEKSNICFFQSSGAFILYWRFRDYWVASWWLQPDPSILMVAFHNVTQTCVSRFLKSSLTWSSNNANFSLFQMFLWVRKLGFLKVGLTIKRRREKGTQ